MTTALLVDTSAWVDFTAAAGLLRHALGMGLRTGAVDCLILAVASRTGAPLLTMDRAQAHLAESMGIECTLLTP